MNARSNHAARIARAAAAVGACLAGAAGAAAQATGMQRFFDPARRYHLELPASWRLLAPLEARELSARPGFPKQLHLVEPGYFHVIGAVDRWLVGEFDGVWLYVNVASDEWVTDDTFVSELAGKWQAISASEGIEHQLAEVRREKVGAEGYEAITALRTSTPAGDGMATQSLDLHVPSGGRQLSFSFTCSREDFAGHEAAFRRMAATLTLAKRSRGPATWSDRLLTPVLVGSLVGVVLVVLYRRSRAMPR